MPTKQFSVLLFAFLPFFIGAQINAKLIQFPDVSNDKVCFTFGNDLWIVDKEGGNAQDQPKIFS